MKKEMISVLDFIKIIILTLGSFIFLVFKENGKEFSTPKVGLKSFLSKYFCVLFCLEKGNVSSRRFNSSIESQCLVFSNILYKKRDIINL